MTPWILANLHRRSASSPIPLEDFMPQTEEDEKPKSNRVGQLALAAAFRAMAAQGVNLTEVPKHGRE